MIFFIKRKLQCTKIFKATMPHLRYKGEFHKDPRAAEKPKEEDGS